MKLTFYPKLAWDGIRKNRRLYLPYILTCGGVVMMFYIIHYLAAMPVLNAMAGGRTTAQMLGFGVWIVALFALIFLFYTNSFLMRRRRKEFVLYNILGMGKGNLGLVLLWETVIIFGLSMGGGLLGGMAFSKLAELSLTRILQGEVTYTLTVNGEAILDTFLIFVPIFCLICLKNLLQLWHLNAVSLLRSENVGEKPPKANYLLFLAGAVILGAAYYIAVSIQSPLSALGWFFVAVGMVIGATYLLFISGSVTLCKLLQKNKGYYYRKNHFVSVSSMAYRMKRNGAGLASICILSTMVLVMMLGSGSLYFGSEESLNARYPQEFSANVIFSNFEPDLRYSKEKTDRLTEDIQAILRDMGVVPERETYYASATVTGLLKDGVLELDSGTVDDFDMNTYDYVSNLVFLSLEDYNRCMGRSETLEADQVLIHCVRRTYDDSVIAVRGGPTWRVKKQVEDIVISRDTSVDVISAVYLVVPDLETAVDSLNTALDGIQAGFTISPRFYYGFDTGLPAREQIALGQSVGTYLRDLDISEEGGFYGALTECREAERQEFYGTYGGIFFLGILLSVVFLLATVLMIYYKQVSEGYEDQGRFEIMTKVGMTRQDIRKSINSQMLTVFFLPLGTAVLHLCFAFPMVEKLLTLFNLRNTALMLTVMAVTVLVFGLFYAFVYKLTAGAYYSIVTGAREGSR